MAKQLSFIKLKGRIGDLSFFKNKDGYSVREKGGAVKSRILKDQGYKMTRENMVEFSDIKRAVRTFRVAMTNLIKEMPTGNAANKLSSIFGMIKNADTSNVRGERKVCDGIITETGIKQLKGFTFTDKGLMSKVINHPYILNSEERTLKFIGLQAMSEIFNPYGANVAGISLFNSKIDFKTSTSNTVFSEEVLINLENDSPQDVELLVPNVPMGRGVNVFAFRVVFYKTEVGVNKLIDRKDYFVGQILLIEN